MKVAVGVCQGGDGPFDLLHLVLRVLRVPAEGRFNERHRQPEGRLGSTAFEDVVEQMSVAVLIGPSDRQPLSGWPLSLEVKIQAVGVGDCTEDGTKRLFEHVSDDLAPSMGR